MGRKLNKKKVKQTLKTAGKVAVPAGIAYGGYKMISDHTNTHSSSSDSEGTSPTGNTGGGGEDTGSYASEGGSDSGSGDSDDEYETKVIEVPIDNYPEALAFANREWNKIKRDNGRQLDVQVLGSCHWKNGEWCKVYLPSFDIDGYMYIIRVSQSSDGGDWTSNLSLVDYPPGWGKEELKSDDENDEEEESDDSSEGGSDSSGSNSSSDNSDGGEGSGNSGNTGSSKPNTKEINGKTYYIYNDSGSDSEINGKTYYNT